MSNYKGKQTYCTPEVKAKARAYAEGGYEEAGDMVPSVAGLACYLGKGRRIMYQWAEKHEDFAEVMESINAWQEKKLLSGGLGNTYNPQITKLMLANHGYSDKQAVDHSSTDGSMKPTNIILSAPDEDSEA